jgi:hypothetical protein
MPISDYDRDRFPTLRSSQQLPTARQWLRAMIDDGSYTVSDILLQPEPLRTHLLMACDGIHLTGNNSPQHGNEEIYDPMPQGVLIVARERNGSVPWVDWVPQPQFGTGKTLVQKVVKRTPHGLLLPDRFPRRTARHTLFKWGIPMAVKSDRGCVIELKWLQQHVATAEVVGHGLEDLLKDIEDRAEVQELIKRQAPAAPAIVPEQPARQRVGKTG